MTVIALLGRTPRRAAYCVAAAVAFALAYDLMAIPVQVSDSLTQLLSAQRSPSAWATFAAMAERVAYFRPLFFTEIDLLFDLARGHYWLAFRGFHAFLLVACVLLFVRALRVQTWHDSAAAVFALTVLTGMHTFRGTVREAFPVSHFLVIVVLCLLALNLARSAGGLWADIGAAATFVVASLTLESGLIVAVVFVTAWACGMRGVSGRGLVAIAVLLSGYLTLRFWYLDVGTPGLEERSSGFLLTMLEPEVLQARFGSNPAGFYAYNVASSALSVLFSEPDGGVFEVVRARLQGDVPPRLYLGVLSSVMTTGLIAWAVRARLGGRGERTDEASAHLLLIAGAVLVANATISYAYTKHEILSVAGAFYAIAVFVAARHALHRADRAGGAPRVALVLFLGIMATTWAFRSAGLHHMLQVQAFKARNDWARVTPEIFGGSESEQDGPVALVRQLRQEALDTRVTNPFLLPQWADRWWGE